MGGHKEESAQRLGTLHRFERALAQVSVGSRLGAVVAAIGLVLMSIAGVMIQPEGPLRDPPPSGDDRLLNELAQNAHERTIDVVVRPEATSVEYRLRLPSGDPILDQAERGSFESDPAKTAGLAVGRVLLATDQDLEPLTAAEHDGAPHRWSWSAPDLEATQSGKHLVIRATSVLESPDPATLVFEPTNRCPAVGRCDVTVAITAPGYRPIATYPTGMLAGTLESGLQGTVDSGLRIDLGTTPPDSDLVALRVRTWMAEFWRYAWMFAPWVVVAWLLRSRFAPFVEDEDQPSGTDVLGMLLWAGLISVFVVTQPLLIQGDQRRGFYAAAPAALVAWAAWAHWKGRVGYCTLSVALPALGALGGLAAVLIATRGGVESPLALAGGLTLAVLGSFALVIGLSSGHSGADRTKDEHRLATGGARRLRLSFLGSPKLALPASAGGSVGRGHSDEAWWAQHRDAEATRCSTFRPGPSARLGLATLASAGVLTAVALTRQATPSTLDFALQVAVSYGCAASYLLVLVWVTAHGADRGSLRWQFLPGVRPAAVVVVGLVLFPTSFSPGESEPLPIVNAVSLASASIVLTQLGLMIVTIALLWRIARLPTTRWATGSSQARWQDLAFLASAVAVPMLLRPEVVYLLPWSMLAGLGLVVAVLVEWHPERRSDVKRQEAGLCWPCEVSGPATSPAEPVEDTTASNDQVEDPAASILKTINTTTIAQTDRRAEQALRGQLTSSGVTPKEQQDLRNEWKTKLTELEPRPSEPDMHHAFGYAATPKPTDRAVRATAIATAIGVPLSVPFLAKTLSDLTDVRGLETWVALLAAFLLLVRFPLYGFYFGYFMPLLKGSTGLAKSARLLVVLVVSEGVALLLPFVSLTQFLQAFGLRALQLALLCVVLGVFADYGSVRSAGRGYAALLDVYGVRGLTFAVSTASLGVLTAAATAVATTSLQTAAEEYVDRILDPPAVEQLDVSQEPAVEDADP